jgi:ferric-dicitrate binding protein FerR (iron transport regulator)
MQHQLQRIQPHELRRSSHLQYPVNDCFKALAEAPAEVCCQRPQPPQRRQHWRKYAAWRIVPSSCSSRGWVGNGTRGKAGIHTAVCLRKQAQLCQH